MDPALLSIHLFFTHASREGSTRRVREWKWRDLPFGERHLEVAVEAQDLCARGLTKLPTQPGPPATWFFGGLISPNDNGRFL